MSNPIWVYLDHFKGSVLSNSWEALGAALKIAPDMGGGVTALVFGKDVEKIAVEASAHGAQEVILAEDGTLEDFRPEPFSALLASQARVDKPEAIFFPNTTRGKELAGMAAVELQTGVIPDVIALEIQENKVVATRPIYAGKLLAQVMCQSQPQLITLRARSFKSPAAQSGIVSAIKRISPVMAEGDMLSHVERYIQSEAKVSLSDASVVVSGGRGLANHPSQQPPAGLDEKGAEIWRAQQGFNLITELAETLGGAVGASRAAVDAGYIPYTHQVGQTGKIISPDLYIACGISGAIQHQAGMRTSKVIVAINRDPEAPIFKLARFGVVGDLYEILPELIQAFRVRLGH
jgi:electron transfer flavoprotein alpha subunit